MSYYVLLLMFVSFLFSFNLVRRPVIFERVSNVCVLYSSHIIVTGTYCYSY